MAENRIEKLQRLCERMHPALSGAKGGPCPCGVAHDAIYSIQQRGPRSWQVRLTDPESGDSIGGVGETIEAALTAVEAKL